MVYVQEQEDYYIPYTIIRYITMEESMSEFLFSVSKHIGKKIKVDVHILYIYNVYISGGGITGFFSSLL